MNLRRLSAIAKKEFLHVLRDPRSLLMGLALPMLLLFMFGYALTLDVDRVPLITWDRENSPQSREFLSHFTGSRYISAVAATDNYRDLEHAIDQRRALLAMVIPHDFSRLLKTGRTAPVQLLVDGSDSNTATIALTYAEFIAAAYSEQVTLREARRVTGFQPSSPLRVEPRVWFNADMLSRNAIVPGLIAVIMMVIAALLTSLTVAREWDTGTMEQLMITPVRSAEIVIGKLVPYFCIGVFDLVVSLLVGRYIFQVPFRGSLALVLALALLFLVLALSVGILISILVRNQFVSSQIAMVATLLPAFLLSGFIFPIENMPLFLRTVTRVIPARYFVTILKGTYLKGVGLSVLWGEALFLALFGAIVITAAIVKFRRKLD